MKTGFLRAACRRHVCVFASAFAICDMDRENVNRIYKFNLFNLERE